MKLIFIGNTAWSMYNFRRSIFKYFIKKGYDVIILAPNDCKYRLQLESLGCRFYNIKLEAKGTNPINDIKTMCQIRKILQKEKPDCCFLYTIKANLYGGFAAASLRIPYVAVVTGLGYVFLVDTWVSRIAKLLYRLAFYKAEKVWFLNQDDISAFKLENIVNSKKIDILQGEGVDVNRFEIHHEMNNTSFLLIARMLWDKGIGEFVQASKILKKKYPNVNFRLLGFLGVDNPSAISEAQMNEWVNDGMIEYLGVTDDVRPFLYNTSCVVLPSYREGIPFSLMEGAAAAKPLIATNTIGCKDLIDDNITGFLCQVKNVNELACCMEKIIMMPIERRIEMGLAGRAKMQECFGIDCVIEKYVDFLSFLK